MNSHDRHSSSTESGKRKYEAAASRLARVPRRTESLATGASLLWRKAQCACGGGCPRCQTHPDQPGLLSVSQPADAFEREADDVAERVMRMAEPALIKPAPGTIQRKCAECDDEEQKTLQTKRSPLPKGSLDPAAAVRAAGRSGVPLPSEVRSYFEPRFGHDFSRVRVHADREAAEGARAIQARAYTFGRDIVFGFGEYSPATAEGQHLLAHELTHVVQQGVAATHHALAAAHAITTKEDEGPAIEPAAQNTVSTVLPVGASNGREQVPSIQRAAGDSDTTTAQPASPTTQPGSATTQAPARTDPLTAALTDSEWRGIDIWLSRGEVGIDPLTDDADHNASLIAAAIFCERAIFQPGFPNGPLCVLTDVTIADARVQALKQEVISRGPIINWAAVPTANRLVYVMELLVDTYHYPVNGAAGIVGNLLAESGVLPSRVEGSAAATPMRAVNFETKTENFSPDEVMNRSSSAKVGPKMPGVGLAQWTTSTRRSGLFQRTSQGRALGSSILFNMDAQVEYLVSELQANAGLNASLTAAGVSANDASDNVVYQFEVPGAILDAAHHRLPRADPAVQTVFATRRNNTLAALHAYQAAHPTSP